MRTQEMAQRAAEVSLEYGRSSPQLRAEALVAVADALDTQSSQLVTLAAEETGLTTARLTGELRRTTGQLRLFGEVVMDGSYLDVRIDAADPEYIIGPRPDVRRMLRPIGPVLNFAASNFPFAFSVAGGDSAAALAAGCPLIVKVHPGHPKLSRRIGEIVGPALSRAGAPDGVFHLTERQQEGIDLLKDDRICAASFTGSTEVGRLLADIAASRPRPIPFYGELGSVNPVYVMPGAAAEEAELVTGFIRSVSGSAGQLCTKPGFMFLPAESVVGDVAALTNDVGEHRLLNPGIGARYHERRDAILSTAGVRVLARGEARESDDGQWYATPTVVEVSVATLREHRNTLLAETFGPLSIIVRYSDRDCLPQAHRDLFPGNLTSTVHLNDAEAHGIGALVDALSETSGRVLFNGWPTGVSVTPAMQHGGPYPATTTDATSVGTAAITRFMRAVAYQDAPQAVLPPPLRDGNPWHVPQARTAAGKSSRWGSLTGAI